jgi:hypothetical protein
MNMFPEVESAILTTDVGRPTVNVLSRNQTLEAATELLRQDSVSLVCRVMSVRLVAVSFTKSHARSWKVQAEHMS